MYTVWHGVRGVDGDREIFDFIFKLFNASFGNICTANDGDRVLSASLWHDQI